MTTVTVEAETSTVTAEGEKCETAPSLTPFKLPIAPLKEATESRTEENTDVTSAVAPFKLPTLPFKKSQKESNSGLENPGTGDSQTSSTTNRRPVGSEQAGTDETRKVPVSTSINSEKAPSEQDGITDLSERKKRKKAEPSPAEKLNIPPLPYKEPTWGGIADKKYSLEILKGGKIVNTLPLDGKSFHVFGRLANCDVTLEHPSISRYHLVLQYRAVGDSERDPGFYLYDLGSTHGSWFNKAPMKAMVYCRIRVGHQFKLGGSTRIFILQGPPEDEEVVSELSVTQLKELKRRHLREQEDLKREKETVGEAGDSDEAGVSWGMGDDAEEEVDMERNPYNVMTQAEKEASYVKDPKKTLRGYFEREGLELEYQVEEKGSGFNHQYLCKVELPVDDADGDPIIAEAAVSGKKKESVIACAMEACRILDAHGVLRQAVHESKSKKKKNWADEDYYDSDDDSYLDRTGMIEKKREKRMMKAGVLKQEVDTYESLMEKLEKVSEELEQNQKDLEILKREQSTGQEEDTLDAFISQLKSGNTVDKTRRAKMKLHVIELRKEQSRLQRLIKLVQPAAVPLDSQLLKPGSKFAALSQRLPMKGFMKGRKMPPAKSRMTVPVTGADTPAVVGTSGKEEVDMAEEEEKEEEEEEKHEEAGIEKVMQDGFSGRRLEGPKESHQETAEDRIPSQRDVAKKPEQSEPSAQKRPKRVLGPQMGPIKFKQFLNRDETEDIVSEEPEVKKRKEKDFADWIPPEDQKGDGRTFLNDKFGY